MTNIVEPFGNDAGSGGAGGGGTYNPPCNANKGGGCNANGICGSNKCFINIQL